MRSDVGCDLQDLQEVLAVDYLVFEDEGYDLIKLKNRITCYNRIASFFTQHLKA